ncbi:MAG: DNA methyltransferase [Saprospiraceae bacterium]
MRRIEESETLDGQYELLRELRRFRVLDPACGSGNFLFIAFKEMKLLEKNLLARIRERSTSREDAKRLGEFLQNEPFVSTRQFYGLDVNAYAVELAKVTLMIAKEISVREAFDIHDAALPLDNLDVNIRCADALFTDWPACEAIIGNPPYQSKNKMQQEFGVEYLNRLRAAYPEVNGRADFCVYWFYKAHWHLPFGGQAGLVGTNTIRQNNSREGSLDYIVQNGGTISNAVSSQDWSGEAAVYVSIVNWKKGEEAGLKVLYTENPDKTLSAHIVPHINSSLSLQIDLTGAQVLACNTEPKRVFQGQTHGHEGFLLEKAEGLKILKAPPDYAEVLRPFLIGDELLSNLGGQPGRFVIDFTEKDLIEASTFRELYKIVETKILPDKKSKAEAQEAENRAALEKNPKAKVNKHHINFYNSWWKLVWGRRDMLQTIRQLPRYIACSQVTKRPIFEFISSEINPNAALIVFGFDDDYSFGIISSGLHFLWFKEKCSTMKGDYRYTTESVWDTFPWPQQPTEAHVLAVGKAAKALRDLRHDYMSRGSLSLRDLYRTLDKPGKNPLRDAHETLDRAVLAAYGWPELAPSDMGGILQRLLDLNSSVALAGNMATKPGVVGHLRAGLVSEDCVKAG